MTLPAAFNALRAYRRFITYELIPDPDKPGKTIKRPTDVRTGFYCKVNDPAHHYSYDEAAATGRPVGFVFHRDDGFFFLDIDGALEAAPGGGYRWNAQATELCEALAGAAVEVSQSGTGLHVIGRGLTVDHSCRNIPAGLELYTHERFVALTGKQAYGDAARDVGAAVTAIANRYFPPNPHGDIAGWTGEPDPLWTANLTDDAELLRAAIASGKKSAAVAFGTGNVTFEDLWTANVDKLAAKWPPNDAGGDFGHSEADAALASHLAYWTGKNCERVKSLMWQSALARQKWEDRPDWLDTTILRAVSVVTNVAQAREPVPPPGVSSGTVPTPAGMATPSGIELRTAGREFLTVEDQIVFFAGCVYIVAENKIWTPVDGEKLDKARFDVVYAGHVFAIDGENKVVSSAWEAFTQSRVLRAPRAYRDCFRPEYPAGSIVHEDGRALVNTYLPIHTTRIAGDPTKFLDHLARILPDAGDRDIMLHYMASMVQNPGEKFQWWPVIQGAEGNGKTLLSRVMTHAIGARYSHEVNPDAMAKTGNQFNLWVTGNLFVGVEEIYVGNRREFLDSFKPTVTNDRIPLEGKGTNQETGDNRINGMLFTNHKEAVPVTVDTRRYAIFYTAQQSRADILAAGMGGDYFPDLYDWLKGRRAYADLGVNYGYSVVNDYLANFPLRAELDPAHLCIWAPATTSTETALRMSLGQAEQEVQEAIEEGRPGFAGGWVSSIALDRLLDQLRARVPRSKRRAMLQSLGFDYHPNLDDGRVNNIVQPDAGKPRLYIRHGHLAANLTGGAEIAKAYTGAQSTITNEKAAAAFAK